VQKLHLTSCLVKRKSVHAVSMISNRITWTDDHISGQLTFLGFLVHDAEGVIEIKENLSFSEAAPSNENCVVHNMSTDSI
jgi:hypothetical protein